MWPDVPAAREAGQVTDHHPARGGTATIAAAAGARLSVRRGGTDVIMVHQIGAGLALTAYDARLRIGVMLHADEPDSAVDAQRAAEEPALFVDSGFALLMRVLICHGCRPGGLRLVAVGCADIAGDLGARNRVALRAALRRYGVTLAAERIAGTDDLSAALDITSGLTTAWGPSGKTTL